MTAPKGDETMTRTIPTAAVLTAAALLFAGSVHAQGRGANASPPGPTGNATASAPTGQAAAQTTNVNVVNAPTVNVGNAVTVKQPSQTPLFLQKIFYVIAGETASDVVTFTAPMGTRMVVENIGIRCSSIAAQPVGMWVYKDPNLSAIMTLIPPSVTIGAGSSAGMAAPVRLLVDDSLMVAAFRSTTTGLTECSATLIGYTTPLP
jgi:hypothetical protein